MVPAVLLRSALLADPDRSSDRLTVVGADGTSERRPIGGGGRGFAAGDDAGRALPPGEGHPGESAAVPLRRIAGRVVAGGRPFDRGEVLGLGQSVPIAADGGFVMDSVADARVNLCAEIEGRRTCRVVPACGDLEVEVDLTPVRIAGQLVGTNWSDLRALELLKNPMSSAAGTQPGILLGPEGFFETPEMPAGCYVVWGAWPGPGYWGVGALIRLDPGERAELILDADHPSVEGFGPLLLEERACQPIEVRVIQ
jgi:hypothetical protein